MLPNSFKRFLWSQDLSVMDPEKHRTTIVVAAINYGDLAHWRWLLQQYGQRGLQEALVDVPSSALRPQAARLAQLLLGVKGSSYASRRAHT